MARNPSRRFKDVVYEQLSRVGKALASPRRLELLDLLAQGPRTVEGLARESGQTIANASQHLKVLREARLVDSEKSGLYVTYRLADQEVAALCRALRGVAESRLAEIERVTKDFLRDRGLLEPVDADALRDRVRRGEVTVLDVRPAEEYRAGHIPGAISLPLAVLERRLATLPRDRELVAYCRGPYCVLAVEAVQRLRREGFQAVRLEDGVPEWQARGFAVAVGDDAAGSDR
ncbi:MAG: metalloregulator ArsR/SmtB family transcription factor [Gemmatimonadota bacterium]